MNIATFIRQNSGAILKEWEQFADSIQPGTGVMDKEALLDHAKLMLEDVADDLDSPEDQYEQAEKSKGHSPKSAKISAAEEHGLGRLGSGFSITCVVSEYRALRASVIRLWNEYRPHEALDIYDLIRFNEALDTLINEAVSSFSDEQERQTRLFETVLSSFSDHGYILDLDGRFLYANKPMLHLLNISSEELIGKSHFDLNFSAAPEILNNVKQVIQTAEKRSGEVTYTLLSGEERHYEYVYSPVFNVEKMVEAIAAAEHDITDRKLSGEQAWRNANHDFLTGLPNRRLFLDRLGHDVKHAARASTPLALMFIDLDRFKEVNDLLGHHAGDQLLKQVKKRIVPCVRSTDTVARVGGDEFTVILQDAGKIEQLAVVAKKILHQFALPFNIVNETVNISACIGITLFPQDATEPDLLLKNADQAMYAAKKAGGNRFRFFTKKMQQVVSARLRLLGDLRNALSKQQLEVFYQPIIDLSDGRIIKAEALLRWHHPAKGLLLPREFIGLAEESGLISEIGNWVFDEAVAHSIAWSDLLGIPFQVTVNTSIAQLLADPYVNWINYAKRVGLPETRISIDVTEGDLVDVSKDVQDKLISLQQAGIQLAIDDFGKGYSLFAFPKKFTVNYLKIDQSFIHSFASNTNSRAVAETIIIMAHKLGLRTIAEGVETVEQKDWLTEADCDYAQGYFFAQAVPSIEFEQLLR